MKKILSVVLALAMILGMATTVFAVEEQITSINLSSINIGKGWAGLTQEEVTNKLSGYSASNCKYQAYMLLDSNGSSNATFPLEKNTQYILAIDLKANEGYKFVGGQNGAYSGT